MSAFAPNVYSIECIEQKGMDMTEWYETRCFGDLPGEAAARFGDREGLVFEDHRYSFAEISAEVDLAARALMAQGVERGDHVAFWLNNCDNWIFIMYALAKIGAVMVPINTRFRTNDLDYVLRQSDSAFLITHDQSGPIDYLEMTREVLSLPENGAAIADPNFPMMRSAIILGTGENDGTISWQTAKKDAAKISEQDLATRAESVSPDDTVFIMYTSGTTGFPKGAMHCHSLIRNVEERGFRMAITPNDTILNYLPLFHAFSLSEGALMSPITGARQIITETFDPDECLDLIALERTTVMHGFEAHTKALTEAQEARPRDISSLRTGVFAAGMHSATPVNRKGARILKPLKPISGFGMTEVWLGATIGTLTDDEYHRCETSGYPALGYEIRVVDNETGLPLSTGMEGELQIRGFSLMSGYYKKPDETAASFAEDGWFKTGDVALWLEDGCLRYLGRYKDMLKVGGENVDPMEVEGLLLDHPAVFQVAVVGCPDEKLTEVAVAYVQKPDGVEIAGEEIIDYCRNKVASFKIPREVVFIDEFPMTASGKIRKVDLRDDAASRFAGT
jgi:fatty-acyl-CoA synthase